MDTYNMKLHVLPKHKRPGNDNVGIDAAETLASSDTERAQLTAEHRYRNGIDTNSSLDCETDTQADLTTRKRGDSIDLEPVTTSARATFLSRVKKSFHLTWWTIEIISMTISFVCMGVLVGTLLFVQNRLSSEWSFWISLNAVIAIAITVAKATLLAAISACLSQEKWEHFSHRTRRLQDMDTIDDASRGPLGSILMLFGVSWGLASIGAVVTVLSLATDTFVQQVVIFEPGTIKTVQEGSATFGYAYGYDSGTVPILEDLPTNYATYEDFTVDTAMQEAVFLGLYQTTRPSVFNCTSNCTWDQDYFTLGFSSSCINVTEQTLAAKNCANSTDELNNCNITTPGGVQFNTGYYSSFLESVIFVNVTDLKYHIGPHFDSGAQFDPDPLVNGSDLVNAAVWTWYNEGQRGVVEQVVECKLGAAIYKYSNVSSISNSFNIGDTEKTALGNCSGATLNQDTLDNVLWWNDTGSGLPDVYISLIDLIALVDFLKSPSFSGGLWGTAGSEFYSPGSAAVFRNTNNTVEAVSGIFDNIARSMTEQLRQGSTMRLAQGLTSQAVVFIRVRWVWLILPLIVQLLGGIVLAVTVIGRKRTKNTPLWKASSVAVLYHSVNKNGILKTDVKDPEELEQIGQRVRARLGR